MKHHKNRSKEPLAGDIVFEEELSELADAITETDEEAPVPSMIDPFEEYVESMRTKIYTNPNNFRSRLCKGYQALLQTLESEHDRNTKK